MHNLLTIILGTTSILLNVYGGGIYGPIIGLSCSGNCNLSRRNIFDSIIDSINTRAIESFRELICGWREVMSPRGVWLQKASNFFKKQRVKFSYAQAQTCLIKTLKFSIERGGAFASKNLSVYQF